MKKVPVSCVEQMEFSNIRGPAKLTVSDPFSELLPSPWAPSQKRMFWRTGERE